MIYKETFNTILLNTIPLDAISLNTIPLNALSLNTKACNSCTIYIVLFVIFFICVTSVFIYFHWCLKKDNVHFKFNRNTQTTIY